MTNGPDSSDQQWLVRSLLRDDLDNVAAIVRQLTAPLPRSDPQQHRAQAALEVIARARRTVDALLDDTTPVLRRQPTRIAPLVERILQSHDPDRQRITSEIPAIVVNVDPVRFERTVDQLVADALASTPPSSPIKLVIATLPNALRLTVTHNGHDPTPNLQAALDRRAHSRSALQETRWDALVTLVHEQHGAIEPTRDQPGATVVLPRQNQS